MRLRVRTRPPGPCRCQPRLNVPLCAFRPVSPVDASRKSRTNEHKQVHYAHCKCTSAWARAHSMSALTTSTAGAQQNTMHTRARGLQASFIATLVVRSCLTTIAPATRIFQERKRGCMSTSVGTSSNKHIGCTPTTPPPTAVSYVRGMRSKRPLS